MTDTEIIKALECCVDIDINACDDCPFQERCSTGEFIETEVIDLINRQKAEIERLKKDLNTDFVFLGRTGKTQLSSQLIRVRVDAIRAEAIKEFAKRLKMANTTRFTWFNEDFDNLVKEMVGDTE